MKKSYEKLSEIMIFILVCISIFFITYLYFDRSKVFIVIICLSLILQIMLIVLFRYKNNKKNNDAYKFNQLIEYNQKRKEIEHEIYILTKELASSGVGDYIDLNRLVFSGQSIAPIGNGINYEYFLEQFGLSSNEINVEKGTALFLTPFNKRGEMLFVECQSILSRMNVFLRKTDNRVEKDDILMNIVSQIVKAEFIIVNIDGRNPNVYYELGIAHAIGKPTILLAKTDFTSNDIGFDIRQKRIISYKNYDDLETQLLYIINHLRNEL